MRLAIIGSREYEDYESLKNIMMDLFFGYDYNAYKVKEVISGGAIGADSLGAKWAKENKIKLTEFFPDWKSYGKQAGFIRNIEIVKNSDMVLALWNGLSKGTAHSLRIARDQKKPTLIIYF
jgi:hypothetical protein